MYKGLRLKEPTMTLSFDLDSDQDIQAMPKTLEILSYYGIKVCFACTGRHVIEHIGMFKKVIKAGHEIVNHTQNHPEDFGALPPQVAYEEILLFQNTTKEYLNYKPKGFRVPHFGHDWDVPQTYTVLGRIGLKYSSSTIAKRCGHVTPYNISNENFHIQEFPLSPCPEHPHGILDTWHSLERGVGKHTDNFLEVFKKLIDKTIEKSSYMNVYFDPQDLDKQKLEGICDIIEESQIRIKKYEDILGDDIWATH